MSETHLATPIAFFIFNRPHLTQKVFEAIRHARPAMLLIVADAPRVDEPGDIELCAQTRAVIQQVDWDCQVLTNFSDINLGCKWRVSSGLDWVFETVEAAIILEDDCLPHPTFFPFCEMLLERYKDDKRIMAISGNNFQFGRKRTRDSYYFSRYNHIWGWASWRRAWKYYDVEMKHWNIIKTNGLLDDILQNSKAVRYWSEAFQGAYENRIDTWDYAWTFACWIQNGLSILPNSNLVSNVGFHEEATHTKDSSSEFANMKTEAMNFPINHPLFMVRDAIADQWTQRKLFKLSRSTQLKQKLNNFLKLGR